MGTAMTEIPLFCLREAGIQFLGTQESVTQIAEFITLESKCDCGRCSHPECTNVTLF